MMSVYPSSIKASDLCALYSELSGQDRNTPADFAALQVPGISPLLPPEAGSYAGSASDAGVLVWLQNCSSRPGMDWLALETVMLQLGFGLGRQLEGAVRHFSSLSLQRDILGGLALASHRWWFEIDSIDPGCALIAVERDGYLLAVLAPTCEGRLKLAVFRPLDAYSLSLLTRLGAPMHPRLGVEMRVNNWELALDCAIGPESVAAQEGRATLGYWPRGLHGIIADDARRALPAEQVAAQLLTYEGYLGNIVDIIGDALRE